MRFFPRGFRTGELDVDARQVQAAYEHHLSLLVPPLPSHASDLVRAVNLHDGLLRRYHVDRSARTMDLRFRAGDIQSGYFDLDVHYVDATVDMASDAVLCRALGDREYELQDDEFDAASTGWLHRFLFWPDGEATVMFRELTWVQTPRRDRSSDAAA
jgi:hypothetical protein